MNQEIVDLKMSGLCCSQIIMQMGLNQMGKTNEDLIGAMAGLCNGVETGKICGCLSAAICLLFLADPKGASKGTPIELTDWFEEAYGETDCARLLDGKLENKVVLCPMIIDNTFKKVEELLEW